MDTKEKERRKAEKARRVPINDARLIVQKGQIDIKNLLRKIDQKIEEIKNG